MPPSDKAPSPEPRRAERSTSWTPAQIALAIGLVISSLGGAASVRDMVAGDGAKTRAMVQDAIKAHAAEEDVKREAHAAEERKARGEITERLTKVEGRERWDAAALCVVNGHPLHPSQPCGLEITTTTRGPGSEVREAYGRLPAD